MQAKILDRVGGAANTMLTAGGDWSEDTDVVDVPLGDRVHIVERVAELHARRVQAGLLTLPVFVALR